MARQETPRKVIYQIRNLLTWISYIGKADRAGARWYEHKRLLNHAVENHHCEHLQRAWDKYGPDCFVFEVIREVDSVEDPYEVETELLIERGGGQVYNSAKFGGAGCSGFTWSASARQNHSEKYIERFRDPLFKDKYRERFKSTDFLKRHSAQVKAYWDRPGYRESFSERTKAQILNNAEATARLRAAQKLACSHKVTASCGLLSLTFPSQKTCADHFGVSSTTIRNYLKSTKPLQEWVLTCEVTHGPTT